MTTKEVCKLMGVTERMCQHWHETKLIVPRMVSGTFSGRSRDYSKRDLLKVGVTIALRNKQVSLDTIRGVLKKIPIRATEFLVTNGKRTEFADEPAEVVQFGEKFPGPFYILRLGDIWEKIRKSTQ